MKSSLAYDCNLKVTELPEHYYLERPEPEIPASVHRYAREWQTTKSLARRVWLENKLATLGYALAPMKDRRLAIIRL